MDKYITLTNNNKYKNNTNTEFFSDVPLFEIKKKCKVSINELFYTNKIKINLDTLELKIITHSKDTKEFIEHNIFIENIKKNLKTIYKDIISNLDKIILESDKNNTEYNWLLYIADEETKKNIQTNEQLLKNNLSKLYQGFLEINNRIQANNNFNFDYYFSTEIDYIKDIKNFIDYSNISKDIKTYFNKFDFLIIISKFYLLNKSLKSKFFLKLNLR